MKVAGVWVAAIALFLTLNPTVTLAADSTGLSFSAGFGYDFISQQYFLDTIADPDVDDIDLALELTTTFLDDYKGQLGITLRPFTSTDFEWRNLFEQSDEAFRLKSTPEWNTRWGGSRIELSGELDYKDQQSADGSSSFDTGYLYLWGNGRAVVPLSFYYNLHVKGFLSSVEFDTPSVFNYDHRRGGLQIGLERLFDDFSSIRLDLFATGRQVPDSTDINYLSLGLNSSAIWLYGGGSLDFWGRFERKDYDRPGGQSDFSRVEFSTRNEHGLGGRWQSRQELEYELTLFTGNAEVNFDFSRLELAGLVGRDIGRFTLLAGPRFELLDERPVDVDFDEDYTEFGGQINLDYFALSGIFLSAQSQLGRRSWRNELSLNSDFVFNRIFVLFDLSIVQSLSLNSLVSAEWEWHDDPQDDSRLYLLSTMLTFEF